MKKNLIIIFIFLILLFAYNSFLIESMIVGKYVNVNYENEFIGDQPHVADTLEIYPNGKFYSRYYGKGKFKLTYSIDGTYISLNPDDENTMGLNTSIDRKYYIGVPKIGLFEDLNQYYEKIN